MGTRRRSRRIAKVGSVLFVACGLVLAVTAGSTHAQAPAPVPTFPSPTPTPAPIPQPTPSPSPSPTPPPVPTLPPLFDGGGR